MNLMFVKKVQEKFTLTTSSNSTCVVTMEINGYIKSAKMRVIITLLAKFVRFFYISFVSTTCVCNLMTKTSLLN